MPTPGKRPTLWRPYTQERSAPPSRWIDHARGAHLYAKDGQKIFDGISSWWLITHGHCTPEIVESVRAQTGRLDQVTFANFTHDPAEEMAELLIGVMPSHLTRIFLTDNGSTAVESALKMAIQSWSQRGEPRRRKFISFSKAYHGDTVGAMSVSSESVFTHPYRDLLFAVARIEQPADFKTGGEAFLSRFAETLDAGGEEIAGVIVEPLIQGAGGMIIWPDETVREIARLCRARGVYLIFDEVMTGFGRTGQLFAMDRLDVTPDLVCLSKGLTGGTLPLAATIVSEEIYASFLSDEKTRMLFHGHSFTGNPIACAAAVASLKLFRDRKTVDNLGAVGEAHRESLLRVARRIPLTDFGVCGTLGRIAVNTNLTAYGSDFSDRVAKAALAQGLFIRPLGSVIYLLPPYCATPAEIVDAWSQIGDIVAGAL